MARATLTYEHTVALDMIFKSQAMGIDYNRMVRSDVRPDGEIIVTDTGACQRMVELSGNITGANAKILDGWYTGTITYGSTYPRISVIHLDTSNTIDNMLCYISSLRMNDRGNGKWWVTITWSERTV